MSQVVEIRSGKHVTGASGAHFSASRPAKGTASVAHEMANLYRMILEALPEPNCRVIEVIGTRPRVGASTIVRLLASAAASSANSRVLICDATTKRDSFRYFNIPSPSIGCLSELPSDGGDLQQAIVWMPSAGFSLASVAKPGMENEVAVNVDRLDRVFAILRQQFDFILIDAGAIGADALGLALAKKADRVLLVIEADRTRAPVIASARRALEANGGHLLGVVLNKRRFRIPRLFYRWL